MSEKQVLDTWFHIWGQIGKVCMFDFFSFFPSFIYLFIFKWTIPVRLIADFPDCFIFFHVTFFFLLFQIEHTHSTSVQMVRCSPSLFLQMRWSAQASHATHARLTRWATARWSVPSPSATPHATFTRVARDVLRSGTSASLAARAPCPNWTAW